MPLIYLPRSPATLGYPLSAAAMRAAVGYGNWTTAHMFEMASLHGVPTFDLPTSPLLLPVGAPAYSATGALGASDKAVVFNASTDGFAGGSSVVGATEDIAEVLVLYVPPQPVGYSYYNVLCGKGWSLTLYHDGPQRGVFGSFDWPIAPDIVVHAMDPNAALVIEEIYDRFVIVMLVLDRARAAARLAIYRIYDGFKYIGPLVAAAAEGPSNAITDYRFGVNTGFLGTIPGLGVSAWYEAKGVAAAAGMADNIERAITRFANTLLGVERRELVLPPPVDPTDLSGEDISLRGGELTITPSGDWATVREVLAARQSVEREAGASPGDFPRRPEWGMGLRDSLLRGSSREGRDRQAAAVRRRLAANPRIDRVRVVDVRNRTDLPAGGATLVTIQADVAGQAQTLQTTVTPRGT